MSEYKEFYGKTLDSAIAEACEYYGTEREKLEIEIVNDAKTGIFGLVGSKKACVRACRSNVAASLIADLSKDTAPTKGKKQKADAQQPAEKAEQKKLAGKPEQHKLEGKPEQQKLEGKPEQAQLPEATTEEGRRSRKEPRKEGKTVQQEKQTRPARTPKKPQVSAKDRPPRNLDKQAAPVAIASIADDDFSDEQLREEMPELALDICSEEQVSTAVLETITKLVTPIVGEANITIAIVEKRIRVAIDCGEASGILVGREGQTLASIQYLVARIVAKQLGGAIRLQIDVGNYRERQDDRLKDLALYLAEKAKKTKRTQATRPLSAYQRRIIHLVLEEDEQIQTHSKGDGPHRRVIIQLKRGAHKQPIDDDIMLEDSFEESEE